MKDEVEEVQTEPLILDPDFTGKAICCPHVIDIFFRNVAWHVRGR
jgi:hypothetical protein